ncbi:MAG: asparagine synthase-related protein [Pyrinomonadaceae bacterium]
MPEIIGRFVFVPAGGDQPVPSTYSIARPNNFDFFPSIPLALGKVPEEVSCPVRDFRSIGDVECLPLVRSDAFLTNRDEIVHELGITGPVEGRISDDLLIASSYKKWGTACVEHFCGDFAFALWSQNENELILARDHLGNSPLFYYIDNSAIAFASSPRLLFDNFQIQRRLNKSKLASFEILEPHRHLCNETWFESIYALPAATILKFRGEEITTRRFWRPTRNPIQAKKSETETYEEFKEVLERAIVPRVEHGGSPGFLLSGGLDSSSITAVAATAMARKNRSIEAFSAVLEAGAKEEDEKDFINEFREFENVNINFVTCEGKGPFSDLPKTFENHDSPFITSRHYVYRSLLESASTKGIRTVFDGSFGEFGATSHSFGGYAEMLSRLHWLSLFRELTAHSSRYGTSLLYNFRALALNPVLPNFVWKLRKSNRTRFEPFTRYSFLAEDLSRELRESIDPEDHPSLRKLPDHLANQISAVEFLQDKMSEFISHRIAEIPVELRYPLLDKRIVEFNLSVPIHMKLRNGFTRNLIRGALKGVLPEKIRTRTSKTPFSPDYQTRFVEQLGIARKVLEEARSNSAIAGILNLDKVNSWLTLDFENPSVMKQNLAIARDHLPQAIYLIEFLRTFDEFGWN